MHVHDKGFTAMATLTLRISDEANAGLDALAAATERSKSFLALRAIDEESRRLSDLSARGRLQ